MMQVETFEVTETTVEGVECDTQSLELMQKLGMKIPEKEDGKKIRAPYRLMTGIEQAVYTEIFSKKMQIESYEDPIPLRVLQVAAHAKECGLFNHLFVWFQTPMKVKDPILVGSENQYQTGKLWMLARWGDALKPFEDLMKIAAQRKREKFLISAKEAIQQLENRMKIADSFSDEMALKLGVNVYLYPSSYE